MYFLDEVFPERSYEADYFVGVQCFNDAVFRRMVVGNYHKDLAHLEVTHSFPKQENHDFCPTDKEGYESFLAMYNHLI